jgi:hypothetical protein
MRTRILVGTLTCLAILAVSALSAAPTRQMAVVRFMKPTIIAGAAVLGAVVFEHDDARMARGEACTKVYFYDAKNKAPGDLIVSFHCTPKARATVTTFEATVIKSPAGPDRLTEYQMVGEIEGHGVPY